MTKSNDMHPICEQFKRLYNDNVWLRKTLYSLPFDLASKSICESVHSCVAIVVHIDKWRRLTIDQLLGKKIELPSDNFFSEFTVESSGEYNSLIDSFCPLKVLRSKLFVELQMRNISPTILMVIEQHMRLFLVCMSMIAITLAR